MNDTDQMETLKALTEVARERERPRKGLAVGQRARLSRFVSGRRQRADFWLRPAAAFGNEMCWRWRRSLLPG